MEIIKPYNDALYLNCSKMQLISYLNHLKVPVELFFYNALESSDKIFEDIVIKSKSRYQFESKLLNDKDLSALGIKSHCVTVDHLHSVEENILQILQKNNAVFLYLDQFYFRHRIYFNKKHLFHSFIISQNKLIRNNTFFLLNDFDPNFNDYVKSDLILEALSHSEMPINIYYYEINSKTTSVNKIKSMFFEMIYKYDDSYKFYAWMISILDKHITEEVFKSIDHCLAIICGSRYLFSKYISLLHGGCEDIEHRLISISRKISREAEILKNVMLRYQITNIVNLEKTIKLVQQLLNSERNLMAVLKQLS